MEVKLQNRPKKACTTKAGALIPFGLIFVAFGCGFSYLTLVKPLWKSYCARNWVQMPCKIISAQVKSHDSGDGTSYSIDILYEYTFYDNTYRSNQYDFTNFSSSGYHTKQALVDQYLRMEQPYCYVDPANPANAVLVRKLTIRNAIGLFPLIFVAAGVGMMIVGIMKIKSPVKSKGQQWFPKTGGRPAGAADSERGYYTTGGDKIILRPQMPTKYKFLFILIFCLFWNGLVSVFVYHMVSSFRTGHPEWFLTFFLIPFELVGIGLIIAVIYLFLALFNPRFELTVSPSGLYPGSEGQLEWRVLGQAGRIRSLTIKLLGREEATYQRGTDTHTDKKAFFEKELVCTQTQFEIASGQARFSIPQETMHSFESDHNKIVWLIAIHGDIARWPDVSQEYK